MANWLPIPTWDGLHPLIVHFPIGLLLVTPVFIVLGLMRPRVLWQFSAAGLILMLLGTIGAWVAVATGEAGMQLVEQTPVIAEAIEAHEEMAERVRLLFTILTGVFALLVAAPWVFKRLPVRLLSVVQFVFLLAYLGSCLALARTGHLGGLLVHDLGVHAVLAEGIPAAGEDEAENAIENPEREESVKSDDHATTH